MSAPVRVLYIDEVAEIGGGANSMLQLLRALDRTRVEPFLATPPGPLADAARELGVKVVEHRFRNRYESLKIAGREIPLNPYRLAFRLADAARLASVARRLRVRLVHTNNLDAHLTGWFLRHVFRLPVVWHIRIMTWPRSLYRMPWPTRIVFVSEAARSNSLGPPPHRIESVVIPNGIDAEGSGLKFEAAEVRDEFGIPSGVPVIGTVGRLTPQKRQQDLVQAAHLLKKRGLELRWLVVGGEVENRGATESHEHHLKKLAATLEVGDEVIFAGDRRDVARIVSSFEVFAFPAFEDSNPRSVLEAMAMAKPIVASRSGGLPEMLDQGGAGLLVEPNDPTALADAVEHLLAHPSRAAAMGSRARDRVRAVYTIDEHARRIEDLYSQILVGGRAAASPRVPENG